MTSVAIAPTVKPSQRRFGFARRLVGVPNRPESVRPRTDRFGPGCGRPATRALATLYRLLSRDQYRYPAASADQSSKSCSEGYENVTGSLLRTIRNKI